jgi:hypothetical protein
MSRKFKAIIDNEMIDLSIVQAKLLLVFYAVMALSSSN